MSYDHLLIERRGRVAIVTLNRPDKRNALSLDMMKEIARAADDFHDDVDTRVVVFAAAGRDFSCGLDLTDPRQAAAAGKSILARRRVFDAGPRMIRRVLEMDQITIAAVHGYTLGGAACLATACDFRVGADDCRAAYPEIDLAIPLSWVSLPLCVHLIGPARAKRFVILGEKTDAATLLQWGFLDEVVPRDKLMERVLELAEAYAAKPPLAAQMVKRSVNALVTALDQSIMHMDTDQVLLAEQSADFAEAIKAFFEKRKPEFEGR